MRDFITEWRAHAPWIQDAQVEQDLVSRGGAAGTCEVAVDAARVSTVSDDGHAQRFEAIKGDA